MTRRSPPTRSGRRGCHQISPPRGDGRSTIGLAGWRNWQTLGTRSPPYRRPRTRPPRSRLPVRCERPWCQECQQLQLPGSRNYLSPFPHVPQIWHHQRVQRVGGDAGGEPVSPQRHVASFFPRIDFVALDHTEHVERLQLAIDGRARLGQPFPNIPRQGIRMPCKVINDGQPQRRHRIACAADREPQSIVAAYTNSHGSAHQLEQLFHEASGGRVTSAF